MKAVTDEQLIAWVAAGDASCLATLFERHHRGVYRYLAQVLRDKPLAEDLTQDVFLKMLQKAGQFDGSGSLKGWMYNIARHVAVDQLRKRGRQAADTLDAGNEPADHRSAEQAAAGSERVGRVMQALATLPTAVQEVIWLGRFEFDNYEDLGQALDCNAGTARVRMHRAMAQLNASYERLHGVPVND